MKLEEIESKNIEDKNEKDEGDEVPLNDDEMMKLAQKYPEFVTLKKMREVKKIGIIRYFQIDWDSVYKSYQTTSLSNFLL